MIFLSLAALIVLAVLLLAIGVATGASHALMLAAITGAIAVAILLRLWQRKDRPFVTDAPVRPSSPFSADSAQVSVSRLRDRDELVLAIDDYDELLAAEILPSLETLSVEELQVVINAEKRGLQRPKVLSRAQRLIDLTRVDVKSTERSTQTGPDLSR